MTNQEALDTTRKIFDAAIKSGMIQTIEDGKALYETYKFLFDQLMPSKEAVSLEKTK